MPGLPGNHQHWPSIVRGRLLRIALATATLLGAALSPAFLAAQQGGRIPLSPVGPWLLYTAVDGLIISNLDGSGRTILQPPAEGFTFHVAPAPTGDRLIVSARRLPDSPLRIAGASASLRLLTVPGGGARRLLNEQVPPGMGSRFDALNIIDALDAPGQPAWAPGGDQAVFASAHDDGDRAGPMPDLYLYRLSGGSITRLTHTAAAPVELVWSPSGRRLLWEDRDGRGSRASHTVMMKTFASASGRTIDSDPIPLDLALPPGQAWIFLGWDGPDRFFYSGQRDGEPLLRGLYIYDAETGAVNFLLPPEARLLPPAFDPGSRALLVALTGGDGGTPGLYRIDPDTGTRAFLMPIPPAIEAVRWEPALAGFVIVAANESRLFRMSELPFTIPLPAGMPFPAPTGEAIVFRTPGVELALSVRLDAPAQVIWSGESTPPLWSPSGEAAYSIISGAPAPGINITPGLLSIPGDGSAPVTLDAEAVPGVLFWISPREIAVLADSRIALRAGPSDDAAIYSVLRGDEPLARLRGRNRAGNWLLVELSDGRSGWMLAGQLTFSGVSDALPILAD